MYQLQAKTTPPELFGLPRLKKNRQGDIHSKHSMTKVVHAPLPKRQARHRSSVDFIGVERWAATRIDPE
jgi:hypothetical protein